MTKHNQSPHFIYLNDGHKNIYISMMDILYISMTKHNQSPHFIYLNDGHKNKTYFESAISPHFII